MAKRELDHPCPALPCPVLPFIRGRWVLLLLLLLQFVGCFLLHYVYVRCVAAAAAVALTLLLLLLLLVLKCRLFSSFFICFCFSHQVIDVIGSSPTHPPTRTWFVVRSVTLLPFRAHPMNPSRLGSACVRACATALSLLSSPLLLGLYLFIFSSLVFSYSLCSAVALFIVLTSSF